MKKNAKIIIFSLFLIALLTWGVIFLTKDSSLEEVKEEEPAEVFNPPLFIGEENNFSLQAAAGFSLFWNEDGEKVLYAQNEEDILPIASISKIMTALVVLENYNIEEPIGITEREVILKGEFRDFRAWTETTIEEMIYTLMIESNNSTAFALALISDRFLEQLSDPVETFVLKMNERAEELMLYNTYFHNPSGLDHGDETNRSTAREIANLSRYILEHTELFEISLLPYYRLYSLDKTIYYDVLNTNELLLLEDASWGERLIGGKTGRTRRAGECLVLLLKSPENNGYIVNIVLGASSRAQEMRKLVEYVESSYSF